MTNEDFFLTPEQLAQISEVVGRASAGQYQAEGEPMNDVSVTFMFSPIGRVVLVGPERSPWAVIED